MDKARIAICEDEAVTAERLREIICRESEGEIRCYCEPTELLEDYKNGLRYDVIFCDVVMKPINGMELCARIREWDKNVYLVFVTNYVEYAPEGYEVGGFRYLLKPVTEDRIKKVLDEIYVVLEETEKLLLKASECSVLVDPKDILYVEIDDKESIVYYEQDSFRLSCSLEEMEARLRRSFFYRVHRKYIVNLERVREFSQSRLTLDNGKTLPISRRRAAEFKSKLYKYLEKSRPL